MKPPDEVRLRHMLDAAREALSFADGRSRAHLQSDRMLMHSLIRLLEVIGEAAAGISESERARLPNIAWREIVGLRNRLIHGYYDVDLDIVWKIVSTDLPDLAVQVQAALESRS